MRSTTLDDEAELADFAAEAANALKKDISLVSYGSVEKGSYFAIRWGLNDRSMLVFQLSDDFEPLNYRDALA